MGVAWNNALRECNIVASYATALFINDAVLLSGTSDATARYPGINQTTAGDGVFISGVIVGFAPTPAALASIYWVASTATTRNAFVCMDPYTIFEIQADSVAAVANTSVGLNANLIFTHAGVAATGISGMELNSSTVAANASFQLLILGAVPREDNDISTVNSKWHVMINLHTLRSTGDGDGSLGV
jgi:hypothetical protein